MKPYIDDHDFKLYLGDVRDVLCELASESVQCVVTSPPYWGLRDYKTGSWEGGDAECDHSYRPTNPHRGLPLAGANSPQALTRTLERLADEEPVQYRGVCKKCGAKRLDKQLGLEETPGEYVAALVEIFREVRRVLRTDGTVFLNLGDGYLSQLANAGDLALKPKDLIGVPWRVAFALQDDGWWLRSDIIWSKNNPLPESIVDRPTKSHEYVFLLTKSSRYFWDKQAVLEPAEWHRWGAQTNDKHEGSGSAASWIQSKSKEELQTEQAATRNMRSVWQIPTRPYANAHFATFPEELPRRCILAGTSEVGCCATCGAPWQRLLSEPSGGQIGESWHDHSADLEKGNAKAIGQAAWDTYTPAKTLGWQPTCMCSTEPVPCVVMDIFMGAGTTAFVARKLGRHVLGVELNEEYVGLIASRTQQLSLLS